MVITPEKNIYLPDDYIPFEYDPAKLKLSSRQLDEFERWTKFVQWGRKNPVLFAEQVFGLEFMDYQRYVFMMSWNTPYVFYFYGECFGNQKWFVDAFADCLYTIF